VDGHKLGENLAEHYKNQWKTPAIHGKVQVQDDEIGFETFVGKHRQRLCAIARDGKVHRLEELPEDLFS
jgi:hypothetical protein